MTVTDQIKILNRKIKQNEVQYDLDSQNIQNNSQNICIVF